MLAKSASSSAGVVGDVVSFQVTASNAFATPLSGVVVTDTLPAGLSYAASAATLGTVAVSGQVVTWTLPALPANSSAQLTLATNLLIQGSFTNTVSSTGTVSASASILVLPEATTHFRMDEPAGSWSGAAGEVLDSGGSGLQGRRVLTATSTTNTVSPSPSIASQNSSVVGGFCNAGNFDGKAVVTVASNALLQYTNKLSASAWIYVTGYPGDLGAILSNDVNYEFHINKSGKLYWWWDASSLTSSTTIPKNTWTHVAITMDSSPTGGRERIYINGVLDSSTNNWKGTLKKNNCDFYIGGDVTTGSACSLIPARNFVGKIDEVKLYNYELSESEVNADMTLGRSCLGSYDHIQIEHDGVASVCSAETVVVKACLDPACNTLYPGSVTMNLATPTGGNWVGGATFTFSGGIASRQLSYGTAGTVTLGTTSASPLPTNPTQCLANGVSTCNLNFAATSCAFDAVEAGANPRTRIYTKLVGTNFNIDLLALGAGSAINTTYTGTVVVDLVDASVSACTTGSGLTAATNIVYGASDAGRKPMVFSYAKAASNVRVRAKVGSSAPACSTDNFAIRPTAFSSIYSTDANADNAGISATATPALRVGTAFNVKADTNVVGYNGLPKLNAALMEWPGVPTGGLAAPGVGAISGSLAFSIAASASTGNAATGSFVYDEVGYFRFQAGGISDDTFTAASGDQAGGDCVMGSSSNALNAAGKYGCKFGNASASSHFGRFIPDHFDVTVATNGVMQAACASGNFTYTGQPMSYASLPSLTIKPMNAASGGSVTQNYKGVFQKLSAGNVLVTPPSVDASQLGADGSTLAGLASVLGAGALANSSGVMTYTMKSDDAFTYTRNLNALVAPYSSAIWLPVASVIDSDTVNAPSGSLPTLKPTGVNLRFGRLRLQNAFGSEKLPLAVPLQAQHWAGSYFVTNTLDSCTALSVPPPQTLGAGATPAGAAGVYFYPVVVGKNQLSSIDTIPTLTSPLTAGTSKLSFPAPLKTGWLDVILQVPDHLLGNWGNCNGQTGAGGLFDDLPCARASFGVYGSKSPIIYRRENY